MAMAEAANEIRQPLGKLTAGNLSLDVECRQLRLAGMPVFMTSQEFDLMTLLLENRDRILSREDLAALLWGTCGRPERKRLAVIIARMRDKLADSKPYAIETVRLRGYGLTRLRQ